MRGEIVTDFSALERLAGAWEELRIAGRRPEVFHSLSWARASWRARRGTSQLVAVAVMDGEKTIGLLPLALEHGTLRFLGAPESDYNDLLVDRSLAPRVLATALDTLLDAGTLRWDRCVLENVPDDSNLGSALYWLPAHLQRRIVQVAADPCPALVLGSDRDAQWRRLLAKSSLRRHEGRIRKKGKLAFRHIEDRAAILAHLPTFFQQHIRRRTMQGSESRFVDTSQRAFYEALIEEFSPTGALRFSVLELDDRPVAYHLGFESDGKFIWYSPTFDVALWNDGPGEVLMRHLLLYCQGAGVRELDFTVGGEQYKYRFSTHVRQNWKLVLFRSGLRAGATRVSMFGRGHLKREWPGVWRAMASTSRALRVSIRRLRTLRQRGAARFAHVLARHFGRAFVSYDEAFVFEAPRAPAIDPPPSPDALSQDFHLEAGSLADLADLATTDPEQFRPRLLESRERFKRGDEFYVARRGGEIVHAAWVGLRSEIDATHEVGSGGRIPLVAAASIIYDCWTRPSYRGQGIYPRVLAQLVATRLPAALPVYIHALETNRASCRGIAKAGFVLWRRLERVRVFGRFERHRMKLPVNGNGRPVGLELELLSLR